MLEILSGTNLIILGLGLIGAVSFGAYLCYTRIDFSKKKTTTKKAPTKKTTTTKKKSTKKK